MFKSKVTKKNVVNAEGVTVVANRVNQDCIIQGDISSSTDIRIDGNIQGNINSTAKIVIGTTGMVKGNIQCEDLTIEGKVDGNISIYGTLYLRKTAHVGPFSVKFKKIIIEEGAVVECQLLPITPSIPSNESTEQ